MSDAFDVFLCHHTADKPEVKEIAERLKERGLRPWLDEWELVPGRPWQRSLEEQIQRIRSAAVFIGEDGFGPWQNLELEASLSPISRLRTSRKRAGDAGAKGEKHPHRLLVLEAIPQRR